MPILFRDYETRSTLNLADVGAWKYATHSQTEVWCCAFATEDGPIKLWIPGDPIPSEFIEAASNPDWLVCAFNDSFERLIEQHIMEPRHGWPTVALERHRCLQAAALALALPAKLEGVAKALNLEHQKDAAGHKLMLQMSRPRRPRQDEDHTDIYWFDDRERRTRLHKYCKQDLAAERALHTRIGLLSAEEQALWQLDAIINERGIHIDGKLLEAAISIGTAALQEINSELQTITAGEINSVNQTDALLKWLAAHDCVLTSMQKSTLRRALIRAKLSPEARRVIELRLDGAHAAAAKLAAMHNWRNGDGRARYTLRYHGSSTGRWSSFGIQVQNMKRPEVDDMAAAIAAVGSGDLKVLQRRFKQPMSVVGDIGRALISAAPGHRLIAADFSGIESRLTAWLSGQQSKLDQWAKFDRTQNSEDEPYFILGHKTFGLAVEVARAKGKTGDLAFGYMGGEGAWQKLAPDDDISSKEEIERRKQAWRQAHPHTVTYWAALNRAAVRAVRQPGTEIPIKRIAFNYDGTFLRMRLPSGRHIAYPFPKLKTGKYGKLVVVFMDNQLGKWVECRHGLGAYGGTWIENAVQAVARDLFAAAMPRLEAADYRIVLHVHDELVVEVPDGFGSADEFLRILTTPPAWADGLPIAAKVREGQRFCKSEKPAASASVKPDVEISDDLSIPSYLLRCPAPPMAATADEGQDKPGGKPGDDHARVVPEELAVAFAAASAQGDHAGLQAGLNVHHDNDRAGATKTDQDSSTASDGGNSGASAGNGRDQNYPHGERRAGRRLATYLYRDHLGANHTRVEKWRSPRAKRAHYPQSFWVGGRWVSEKPKCWLHVPYRLPEMLAALAKDPGADVFVPEGEKDCETLVGHNLIATTNAEGATPLRAKTGKWIPELSRWFYGVRRLFIPADNDEVGRAFAKEKARALETIVPSISIVLFPDVPEGEDVSYWLNELGHSKEELLARCEAAERWQGSGYVLVRASDIVPRPMDWLWQGHILRGSQELLTGVPGGGKSQIHCAIVSYVTTGRTWPDGCNGAPAGNVIMLTAEDCLDQTITPRLIAAGADRDRVFILKKIRKDNKERMFLLSEDIEELEHRYIHPLCQIG